MTVPPLSVVGRDEALWRNVQRFTRAGLTVRSVTTSGTVASMDGTLLADATSGAVTLTLPNAAEVPGYCYRFKKTDASANAVVVQAAGAQTIDGAASTSLVSQNQSITLQSTGEGWLALTGAGSSPAWSNQLINVVWGTPGAEVGNAIEVLGSCQTLDGTTALTGQVSAMVVVTDSAADAEPSATATISAATSPVGTLLGGGGTATAIFKTDSNGQFKIRVSETTAANRYIWVKPGGHHQLFVKARDGILQLTFA